MAPEARRVVTPTNQCQRALMPSDAERCVIGRYLTLPDFSSGYPFLQIIEFIKYLATYFRARGAFPFHAPALQRPQAAAQHFCNAMLAEKVSVVDNDLVASSGRRRSARL